jgi:hypothetical protein
MSTMIKGWTVVMLLVFLPACGPSSESHQLGTIDLSTAGSKCDAVFRWNAHFPVIALTVPDGKGGSRPIGLGINWPIAIQLDVTDMQTGAKLTSRVIKKEQFTFTNWHVPATCISYESPDIEKWRNLLVPDHQYKSSLTVLQPLNGLGDAEVDMQWAEGGDSL